MESPVYPLSSSSVNGAIPYTVKRGVVSMSLSVYEDKECVGGTYPEKDRVEEFVIDAVKKCL